MSIEKNKLKNIIEAALMAVAKPMTVDQLMGLFSDDERPSNSTMKECIAELQSESEQRGVELKQVASGYRYQAKQEYSEWLSRLWEERPAKYSRAALETLALIAYRQPVTRAEIEDVRGVGVSSSIVKTMIEREWIRVVGHRDVPGRPALYATTKQFLDYFNMQSLEELPSLAEIKDLEDLNPELDLPDPDEERAARVNVESAPEDTEESAELQDNPEETTDETDAHLQTEAFNELDDLHTEAIDDSFYENETGENQSTETLDDEENQQQSVSEVSSFVEEMLPNEESGEVEIIENTNDASVPEANQVED
jgi:segregation and condensation protein B